MYMQAASAILVATILPIALSSVTDDDALIPTGQDSPTPPDSRFLIPLHGRVGVVSPQGIPDFSATTVTSTGISTDVDQSEPQQNSSDGNKMQSSTSKPTTLDLGNGEKSTASDGIPTENSSTIPNSNWDNLSTTRSNAMTKPFDWQYFITPISGDVSDEGAGNGGMSSLSTAKSVETTKRPWEENPRYPVGNPPINDVGDTADSPGSDDYDSTHLEIFFSNDDDPTFPWEMVPRFRTYSRFNDPENLMFYRLFSRLLPEGNWQEDNFV